MILFWILDVDVLPATSYHVYISQFHRFAIASSLAKSGTLKLKIAFSVITSSKSSNTFYCRHSGLMSKYNIGLKSFLQGLLESFLDLVYEFKKIFGKTDFSAAIRKVYHLLQKCRLQQGYSATNLDFSEVDPREFPRGVDLIILPYLLYICGETGLCKPCIPRSDATERGVNAAERSV